MHCGKDVCFMKDLEHAQLLLTAAERDLPIFVGMRDVTPFAVQFRYSLADTDAMPLDRVLTVRRVKVLFEEVSQRAEHMKKATRKS